MHSRARQLLQMLVASPEALSRNRHFSLFEGRVAAELRRRASLIRFLRDRLLSDEAVLVEVMARSAERGLVLRFDSGATQETWLSATEMDVLRKALEESAAPATLLAQFSDGGVVEHGC